ncbi:MULTISPECIES: beta-N-acetylhexosaminidase [Psychrobacillus]|uniref:beta-N-acetylhexosaminidase n=1 Tax=Psychrobacillus faecigallinarum TaxID=2762235 RepID=A0ABR8RBZ7_9BACI|nr:beta-N-acetylhexosaminidase [Psychrobacillus faecigallinarum]MBD7945318.1 beta-N-acetylhexosaminidase [Psychrobacillus faecigallinarum]
MIKKIGIIIVVIFMFTIIEAVLTTNKEEKSKEFISEEEAANEGQAVVSLVFELAEKGQVINVPFIVGETDTEQLYELWGVPDESSNLSNDIYDTYLSRNATVGHHSGTVFDIRTNSTYIQEVQLEDIHSVAGEPDIIRSYQDEGKEETILVYEILPNIQLKWILPKPTENDPNPNVHHISVYTDLKEVDSTVTTSPVDSMSLEEKVGQMIFGGIEGVELSEKSREMIREDKVGGIIFFKDNLVNANQIVTLLNSIKAENMQQQYPLFLGIDQEGGRVTRIPELNNLPTNKQIGKKDNPALAFQLGELLGKQLNAFGFNLDFAPVLDVDSNPNNPVIGDRSFGSDPKLVSELGISTMKGLQSENVISVIKHFPGHGDTEVDSHIELPIVSKNMKELQALEFIPFQNALKSGADVVMIGHILLPEIDANKPSSISNVVITKILREQLKYEGVVMTDDMTMKAILDNYEIGEAAVEAVKAGNDIVLIAHDYEKVQRAIQAILEAVQNEEIKVEQIDRSVERILQLKEKYQLSNDQLSSINVNELNNLAEELTNNILK